MKLSRIYNFMGVPDPQLAAEVMEPCHLTRDQAAKLLKKLEKDGKLTMEGMRREAYYYVLKG